MHLPAEFERSEAEYAALKQQVAAGRISAAQFEAALLETMVEHEDRFWMLGANSGRWYVHDGTAWTQAQPPTVPSPCTAEPEQAVPQDGPPAESADTQGPIGPPGVVPAPAWGPPRAEPDVPTPAEGQAPDRPQLWVPPHRVGTGDVCPSCGTPVDARPTCSTCGQVHGLPAGVRLSGRGKRLLAALLESVLFFVTLGVGWLVWGLVVWAKGTTPAKQLMRMRVIWVANRRVATWGRMFLRDFFARGVVLIVITLLTLGIGWLVATCMIFGRTRRPLWDRMASTLVVDGYVDHPPQEPAPALPDWEAASYARKDRLLAVAGVAALILLLVGDFLLPPVLESTMRNAYGPVPNYIREPVLPGFPPPGPAAPSPLPPSGPAPPPPTQASPEMTINIPPDVMAQPGAAAAGTPLIAYFGGINSGNLDLSWATLTPAEHARLGDKAAWEQQLQYSKDTGMTMYRLRQDPDGYRQASVLFTSNQPAQFGPDGDTCDHWDLTYTLVPRGNIYLIDGVAPTRPGAGHTTC
ncbi:RDD family protein [Saccharopolyspora shandongensis]|uniref:RDD family protein n=1 Tax=Saccharopolyspora shandongensis TaxID=418495 RepID=UPI0033FBBE7C